MEHMDNPESDLPSCASCAWFDHYWSDEGFCRRNAPIGRLDFADNRPALRAFWPVVAVCDWCGEYKASE